MLFPIKDYNPTRRTAYITILFITLNVVVFLFQRYLSDKPFAYHIGRSSMVPYEVTHLENTPAPVGQDRWGRTVYVRRDISPILSLFTSMFMHGSFMHLFGNMLFLWIFGNNIEDFLGKTKFVFFYLACGLGASGAHILFNINSNIPVIGASGAVSGVMGAYLILYPQARVRTLVFILFFITFVDIPAFVFLIVWFAFQFFYAGADSGIAWLAHVGGFLIGIALIKLAIPPSRRGRGQRPPKIEIIQ
jgi:membrane associated rhomboid family serine protease